MLWKTTKQEKEVPGIEAGEWFAVLCRGGEGLSNQVLLDQRPEDSEGVRGVSPGGTGRKQGLT